MTWKRLVFLSLWLMMLSVLFLGIQKAGNTLFGKAKLDMTRLEEQLRENAKIGIQAAEFPEGRDWLNVPSGIEMSRLRGKVVLLDFWTFCCINCMHVIPELKRLEAKYPDELVVVGVHSAKFSNERDLENVRQSVLRYEVRHPVVNDPALTLWQQYGVRAWPTLVLIDPQGKVVLSVSGEGHYDLLDKSVSTLIRWADQEGVMNRDAIEVAPEAAGDADGYLRYPGKIFADENELVIADSNHNQILIADYQGHVLQTIGNGTIGSRDGSFRDAQFNHPQGIFREGGVIYVADTENHLIRLIDLRDTTVRTIAGTGAQGRSIRAKAPSLQTPLPSPWALVKVGDLLYIAMAGSHQIWSLDEKKGEVDRFAGSGREDIIDGRGESSALAQPSDITFDGAHTLYFADSEVSAVRSVDLKTREVKTLVGHGLFDFGDQDGPLLQALLQHPLGVHYADGFVYVADTYNDKIKRIDLKNRTITTLAGSGEERLSDGTPGALYEPGGLSSAGGKLFVADTNNHAIRVVDLKSGSLSTLLVRKKADRASGETGAIKKNPFLQTIEYPPTTLAKDARVSVSVRLPADHEFTEGLPVQFYVGLSAGGDEKTLAEGTLDRPSEEMPLSFGLREQASNHSILKIDLNVPYCTTVQPKLCKFKSLSLVQPLFVGSEGESQLDLNAEIR